MEERSSQPEVRERLQQELPTTADLDRFCQDYFPTVYQRFAPSSDRLDRTNLLLAIHTPQEVRAALARTQRRGQSSSAANRAVVPPLFLALLGGLAVSFCCLGYYTFRLQQRGQTVTPTPSVAAGLVTSPNPDPARSLDLSTTSARSSNQSDSVRTGTVNAASGGFVNTGTMIGNSVKLGAPVRGEKAKR